MNLKEDKFKLVTKIKSFILDSEKLLENIPRYDFYNRDKFRDDITEILHLVYLANNIDNIVDKKKYQQDIFSRLSMIDFYLERAYMHKYISEKQLYKYSLKLEEIMKMTKGWINSNEWCYY